MEGENHIAKTAQKARAAANELGSLSSAERNDALEAIAQQLEKDCDSILKANESDCKTHVSMVQSQSIRTFFFKIVWFGDNVSDNTVITQPYVQHLCACKFNHAASLSQTTCS
jgi:hypothetical protein